MNIESKKTRASVAMPGVFITTRTMTEGRRIKLRLAMSPDQRKVEELVAAVSIARLQKMETDKLAAGRRNAVGAEKVSVEGPLVQVEGPKVSTEEEGSLDPEQAEANKALEHAVNEYFNFKADVIDPARLQWGLESVRDAEGNAVLVDGMALVPSNFVELAPSELYAEALIMVDEVSGLTEPQVKNSESPTTSNAAEPVPTSDTTA